MAIYPTGYLPTGYVEFDAGTGIFPSVAPVQTGWGGYAWGVPPWAAGRSAPTFPTAGAFERMVVLDGLLSDRATVTTAQTAAVTASNLLNQRVSHLWRSTVAVDALLIDLPYPVAVNAMGLRHRLGQAGITRVRAFGSTADRAARTGRIFDTDHTSLWPLGVKPGDEDWGDFLTLVRWTNEVPVKYLLIDLSDISAAAVAASRIMICRAWQPGINMDFEGVHGFEPSDIQASSDYGGLYAEQRPNRRTLQFQWSNLAWNDTNRFCAELHRRASLSRDLMVFVDPSETADFHRLSVHGLLAERGYYKPQPKWNDDGRMAWTAEMNMRELIP